MSLSIGIIGLPNVGKSTLFNALTKKQIEASNYPFCTIDPNIGVVKVPDVRLDNISKISKPKKIIPTFIEFIDIAGIVKGANKGEGLGNKFLSHIRECDAICEVVRDFKNKDIIHVNGKLNPKEDKETIDTELLLADLSTIEKRKIKVAKYAKSGDKEMILLNNVLEKVKINLENGVCARNIELTSDEKKLLKELNLLTIKPIIYLLNIDESYNTGDVEFNNNVIEINAKLESEIALLSNKEQKEYIKELGLKQSGLEKLINYCYNLLGLLTFFTTGKDESRAWTIKKGDLAPIAAGKIHTDIEKGFIRAEVIGYEDFIKAGGEQSAREKGLLRTEGKNYIVQDGDICNFLHN